MKVLSLWQPWASLCVPLAPGEKPAKNPETRGWSTKYRGRLLIHAAKRRPPLMYLPPLPRGREGRDEPRFLVVDTITDPAYQGPQPQGRRIPKRAQTPTLFFPRSGPFGRPHEPGIPATEQGTAVYLPLGTIVGSVNLVDVVPIVSVLPKRDRPPGQPSHEAHEDLRLERHLSGELVLCDGRNGRHLDDQLPYGDFTPGRYAGFFEDAKRTDERCPACWGEGGSSWCERCEVGVTWENCAKHPGGLGGHVVYRHNCPACHGKGSCDPIPAKGKQGLWEWTP